MPIEEQIGYGMYDPAGRLLYYTVSVSEDTCHQKYIQADTFDLNEALQQGYRCIKVKIVPIEEDNV
jgi:hypothetical protein